MEGSEKARMDDLIEFFKDPSCVFFTKTWPEANWIGDTHAIIIVSTVDSEGGGSDTRDSDSSVGTGSH
jgi:hypothetical protein